MTMDRGVLDVGQQVDTWDTLMAAQAPSYDAPIQYNSDAFALPADAPYSPAYEPSYTEPAQDAYSYATAAPDSYQAESYGPPAPLDAVAPQEYQAYQAAQAPTYDAPDFSYQAPDFGYQPEMGGSYTSNLSPYDASPATDWSQLDPAWNAMEQQYVPDGSPDQQAILDYANSLGDGGMEGQIKQGIYSSLAGNVTNDQSLGAQAFSKATTPIGPLKTAADFMINAAIQNRSLANQVSTGGITGPVSDGNYYAADPNMVSAAGNLVLPTTPLDLAMTAIPAALAFPEKGLYGALAEGLAFGTGPMDALPDAAKLRSVLEVPQYADEAARLADQAGQTVIPRTFPAAAAETAPLGVRIAGAGVDEATKVADEFAGNIRLAKYPEDIRAVVSDWATANPDIIDAARRGVRSDAQVLDDARTLVNDLGGDFAKLQRTWKAGEAFNAEEVTAIRGALTDSTRKVMDAATLARTADSTENQLKLAEAILEQQRIQQIATGVTAEAGRSLRAFRTSAQEALANGDVGRMQQILKQAIGNSDGADIAKLTDAIRSLDINDPVAVNSFLRSVNKPGFWDYLTEYWYNSILSGPWTHMRNIIGNTASTMTEPVRRLGAAGVEDVLARAAGRTPERFWQEAPASIVGAVHGIPEGIRGALQTVKTGFNPQDITRIELRRQAAIPGPIGKAIRIPSTALEAADSFFYSINYRMSLYANATRTARREGLAGTALSDRIAHLLAEPSAPLVKRSAADAERLLFRGDPGQFANWLSRGKEQFPALQFVIPFIKTPANLLKFGIRNSPLGLMDVPMWRRVLEKSPEASDELAQTLMGSAVAAGLGAMVANGQLDITAGVPTDSAERDRFYREGKLPFAVKMPGVGWVQYNQIPGLDTTLTALASVVEGVRNGDNVDDIASQIGGTIAQSMLDRSYMSGLSDFMDAIGDPTRFAARYATRQATSTVPYSSFFRQVATAIDPTIRSPKTLEDSFKANLPGLTGDVPTRLTALGEAAQRGAPTPIQVSGDSTSPLDAELGRLGVEVTFVGTTIGGHKLSTTEQHDYQELAGKQTAEYLNALIDDPRYQALDDAGKQKILEKAIDLARNDARDILKENDYRIPENMR